LDPSHRLALNQLSEMRQIRLEVDSEVIRCQRVAEAFLRNLSSNFNKLDLNFRFANKGSSFGQLAQQSSGFGPSQQQSPFGSGFSGNTTSPFGSGSAFGSGGVSSFGSASSFSTPQQNKS
jgi:hypothetical protein